jgi:hypothetical protein
VKLPSESTQVPHCHPQGGITIDNVRFYSRKGRLTCRTLLHRPQCLQRCTLRLGYPTQASNIQSASSADTGVQLVWARLHQ